MPAEIAYRISIYTIAIDSIELSVNTLMPPEYFSNTISFSPESDRSAASTYIASPS